MSLSDAWPAARAASRLTTFGMRARQACSAPVSPARQVPQSPSAALNLGPPLDGVKQSAEERHVALLELPDRRGARHARSVAEERRTAVEQRAVVLLLEDLVGKEGEGRVDRADRERVERWGLTPMAAAANMLDAA